uniref:Uncharacterized protein n=1 Tax=Bactrocera dorsalis TaxID=27457 RepID=A0A034WQ38_BACDO
MRFLTVVFLFGLVAVSSALSNSDDLVKTVPIVEEVSEEKQVVPEEDDAEEETNDAEERDEVEENADSKESDDSNASDDDNSSNNEAKKTVTRIYPRFVGLPLHIGVPRFNLPGHWVGRLRNSTVKAVEPEIK